MTQSVQARIGMSLDLFPYLAYLFLQHPRPQRLCRILRVREEFLCGISVGIRSQFDSYSSTRDARTD
jgi:hypothetical protein